LQAPWRRNEQTPQRTDRDGAAMSAIGMIIVFIAVMAALNIYEHGRAD
jgi:hypothetical protein